MIPRSKLDVNKLPSLRSAACRYAGVRPERIRRLVNLEGFGMAATRPEQAPARYAKWMDEIKKLHADEMDLKAYDTVQGVARRLMKTNPRLGQSKADWLAPHWARANALGQWEIMGDPAHKVINAQLYRVDEVLRKFTAASARPPCGRGQRRQPGPVVEGKYTLSEYTNDSKAVPDVRIERIADPGHMLHHDQPELLASLIENFIARGGARIARKCAKSRASRKCRVIRIFKPQDPHHGSRTHQPHRHSTLRFERPHRRFTGYL
ncbi:MAG: alpha/beta hydrolase [Rhodoferax sp.]|nr:alpha/beta hydrolase [Rhodoferax sp.]